MKGFFYKNRTRMDLPVLMPDGDEAHKIVTDMAEGEVVEIEVRRPRNIKMHRFFWKLCSFIAQSAAGVESAEEVAGLIKLGTGHCWVYALADGTVMKVPKSISFASMDQTEFNAFLDKGLDFVAKMILPHLTSEEIIREVERMVGGLPQ